MKVSGQHHDRFTPGQEPRDSLWGTGGWGSTGAGLHVKQNRISLAANGNEK